MTLQECVALAIEHNLDLQVQRINPLIQQYTLSLDYAGYEPSFNGSYSHSYSLSPGGLDSQNRPFQGSETDTHSVSASVGGLLPWGTTYSVGTSATDSYGTSPNPQNPSLRVPFESSRTTVGFGGGASGVSLRQPLLKNSWIDQTRLTIALARKDLKSSDLALRGKIMDVVLSVQNAYYELIFARENVKVQEKALQLAEQLLAENKKRVEVGALAPLDEKQAESQAAASRADLLAARHTLVSQQNALKTLLTDKYSEWHDVDLMPSESLEAQPQPLSLQDSWQKALTQRPDLLQARLGLEKQDITVRYDRNQLLPQVDVNGSIGYTGSGQEFSDAYGMVSKMSNPFWGMGVSITIPLGNRAARENLKIGKALKTQLVLQLKKQEQDIMVTVDDAVGQVQSSFERADATKQARIYAEAALDAEQKKLANGKSTSFQVLQFQRDLTARRSDEIRSLADYNEAVANLARQEASILEKNHITIEVK